MRCEEARAEYLGGETSEAALEHLSSCPRCLAHSPALESMSRLLADPLFWVEPPPELEQTVERLIDTSDPEQVSMAGRRWRWRIIAAAAVLTVAVATGAFLSGRQPLPDWEITTEGIGPGESAVAMIAGWNEVGGTRVVVAAEGLASAPDGYTYELWFIDASSPVSAGTFAVADTPVELFVGVARRDYPRVAVTLEPLDGDATPSAVFVFDTGA
ncbi:MAG: hypothetical protein BMS9Abin07_0806 [Acidimicrobiia bacterium]|nr:MAG: hypothetical protein BMS9Abin07_0806 [Acidimicrobiia bacterium]